MEREFRDIPEFDDLEIDRSGVIRNKYSGFEYAEEKRPNRGIYNTGKDHHRLVNLRSHGVRYHRGVTKILKQCWPEDFD